LFAIIAVSAKWPSFRITTWRGFRAAPFLFSKLNFNVRFGSLADICSATGHVRFTPNSDRESGFPANGHVRFTPESDIKCDMWDRFGPKADIC
jgi:hypothetical protein